jgi:hypothetical protein
VEADVENTSVQGEQVRLTVNVTSDGGSYTVTAHDVVVTFNADNGSTIQTTENGTTGEPPHQRYDVVSFNETFSHPPVSFASVSVRSKSRRINGFYVEGARRSSEDSLRYESFTQDE